MAPVASPTPLPWKSLLVICAVRLAEPIAATMCFPFLPFMIRDFHLSDNPDDVGYYLGWMASSFCLAQFCTTIIWGSVSDKFGRRPIILIGLLGTAITNSLFGFSTNYKFALITRTLCGSVNANIGIIRSMVAEMTNHSNHARAFSLLPLTMGVGTVAGPMLGALFVRPVEQFPGLFEWLNIPALADFFTTYPYSLPCLIGSTFCLCGAIFGYFNLEETLPGKRSPDFEERFGLEKPADTTPTAEETTGLLSKKQKSNYVNGSSEDTLVPLKDTKSSYLAALTPDIQKVILSYVLICGSAIMETELFALWTTSDITSGGLGFNSKNLGTALTIGGISMMFMQVIVYPRLQRRFGTVPVFRTILAVATVIYFSQGFVREFAQRQMFQTLWTVLIAIIFIKSASTCVMFTSSMILVASHGANSNKRGFINGLAETLAAGIRAIGPAIGGTAYSWALSASYLPQWLRWQFVFIIVSSICFATFIESWWIREAGSAKRPLDQVAIVKSIEQEELAAAN